MSLHTVYVGHSRGFDYQRELYAPLVELALGRDIRLVLPHQDGGPVVNTKELFRSGCALFLAEVTYPSTGLGMELAYAGMLDVPTVCFHRASAKVTRAIRYACDDVFEYTDPRGDMVAKIAAVMDVRLLALRHPPAAPLSS